MTQPRLLADFAAVPTPRERRHARATNRAAQLDLFGAPIDEEHQDYVPPCAVCASLEHQTNDCPHGSPLELLEPEPPTTEGAPMHISTSAQRDENRLTDDDRERIRAAVTPWAKQTPTMGTGERYTTAERIAHRAIGCTEHDLRESELLEIRQLFKPILAAHNAGRV